MNHTISRYGSLEQDHAKNPTIEQPVQNMEPQTEMLKNEIMQLRSAYLRMMGKELSGLSFIELQHLEEQLCEGIHAVKEKKEEIILEQLKRSRHQEQMAILEKEALRKKLEELQHKTNSPFHEFNPEDGTLSFVGSKHTPNCASDDNELSHTSLQLGLSMTAAYGVKRKAQKLEPRNDSGSQIVS